MDWTTDFLFCDIQYFLFTILPVVCTASFLVILVIEIFLLATETQNVLNKNGTSRVGEKCIHSNKMTIIQHPNMHHSALLQPYLTLSIIMLVHLA